MSEPKGNDFKPLLGKAIGVAAHSKRGSAAG